MVKEAVSGKFVEIGLDLVPGIHAVGFTVADELEPLKRFLGARKSAIELSTLPTNRSRGQGRVQTATSSSSHDDEAPEGRTTLGPWGGPGTQWSYSPEYKITQIVIHRNKHYISSIIFKTQNGESSAKFGDEGGEPEMVDLNSSEYITGVCGKYSWNSYVNQDTIRSLCFYTNEKQYGPFGRYEGNRVESFSSRIEGGVVVGFHGCIGGGKQLASIGFYAKPGSFDPPPSFITESGDVGPWGIAGGLSWDDGAFSEVTEVFVNTDQSHNVIHGIKFEYAETNGKRVWSNQHGSSTNSDVVKKWCL
ncbi:hypothetical protein RJ639_039886 [Escallonia herrerae]|uniref:Jacalin-type lectin domain-containing protein n=1 Tax=Escallonia herrerae TaxID=1293975 RepID=A0AA88WNE4_9ASTE|nr:hypothetical protein RJ639_039886 [Escallonia herrerae]